MIDKFSFDNTELTFSSRSNKELRKMHLLFSLMGSKQLTKIGTYLIKTALRFKLPIKKVIKKTIFEQFCGGESLNDCKKVIYNLKKHQISGIPDFSVEGESLHYSYENTFEELKKVIKEVSEDPAMSFAVFKMTGLCSHELLEKVQKKTPLSTKEHESLLKLHQKVDTLCGLAAEKKVKILIDAEETWIQNTIDEIAIKAMKKYNHEQAIVFNTYQLYRKDGLERLMSAHQILKDSGKYLGVKPVRGAYMEKERARAKALQYPDPIFENKKSTDEAFDNALRYCIEHIDSIAICAGTHNMESCILLTELMEKSKLPNNDARITFAQLYGMSDHISYHLAAAGYNVSKYLPYGPIEATIPYLFRRAEENKSVTGQTSRELEMIKKEIKRRKTAK